MKRLFAFPFVARSQPASRENNGLACHEHTTEEKFQSMKKSKEGNDDNSRASKQQETLESGRNMRKTMTTEGEAGSAKNKSSLLRLVRDLWSNDASVVKHALTKLAVLCHGDDQVEQIRKDIGRIGGPLTIVKAMERLNTDPSIQARGCGALANLAYNDEIQSLIAMVGGVDAVVLAMKNFPDHSYLQECGCGALRNLAFKNKANQGLVQEAGGVSVIITAMGTHAENDRIQDLACSALYNVADGLEDMGAAIVSSGGLLAITKAAEKYLDNPEVKEAACNLQNKLLKAILSG